MKCKIIILFFVILTISDANLFTLKKCCPLGKQLNSKLTSCQNSIRINEWEIESGLLKILPKNISYSIPSVNISDEMILNIPCKAPKIATVIWNNENPDFSISDLGVLTANKSPLKNKQFSKNEYCLDDMQSDEGMKTVTVALVCPCLTGTCVNVCCENGMLVNTTHNTENKMTKCSTPNSPLPYWRFEESSVSSQEQNFFVVNGAIPNCKTHIGLLNYNDSTLEPKINFTILANGTLLLKDQKLQNFGFQPSDYCVGVVDVDGYLDVNALICSGDDEMHQLSIQVRILYSTLNMIGALFYLATLFVHILLPELRRTVRGLSLMAHCIFMPIGHIAITALQIMGSSVEDTPCYILAYTMQFSLLVGFFWMNVMCIDISVSFRSLSSMIPHSSGKYRKFWTYAIYAIGLPFLILLTTYWVDTGDHSLPVSIKPNIGKDVCFFDKTKGSLAIVVFFYGPLGVVLFFNLCLFLFTTYKIIDYTRDSMVNNQDSQRHDNRKSDKKRFVVFLKLFGLMGIPWITEIISWAVGGADYYWYFTDAVNLLRSVLIFIMFCCKKKVWQMMGVHHPNATRRISRRLHVPPPAPRVEDSDTRSVNTLNTLASNNEDQERTLEEIAMERKQD